ncbi:MAG: hypothetical protein AAGH99_06540 [Planctomycetota bacterium]
MKLTSWIDSADRHQRLMFSTAAFAAVVGFAATNAAQAGTDFGIEFTTETALVDVQVFGPGSASQLDTEAFNFFAGDGLTGIIGGSVINGVPSAFTEGIPGVASASLDNVTFDVSSGPGSQAGDIGDTFVTEVAFSGSTQAITGPAVLDGFLFSETAYEIVNTSEDTAFRLAFEVRTQGSVEISVDDPDLDSVFLEPIITGPSTADGAFTGVRLNPQAFDSDLTPGGDLVETFDFTRFLVIDLLPDTVDLELSPELLALVPEDFSGSDFFYAGATVADLEFFIESQPVASQARVNAVGVPSPTAVTAGVLVLGLMTIRRCKRC